MTTFTQELAHFAASVRYEDLPGYVVEQAKRFLWDSVGCALGGSVQSDVQRMKRVLTGLSASGPATVLVSGEALDPLSAALLNSLMIRVLDYNDIYWQQDPCHPSDIIPAAMAAAEVAGTSAREMLVGIVLAYEFMQRFCEVAYPGIRERGWHHATFSSLVAAAVAGRVLGLPAEQIAQAMGISGSRHCVTGSVTAGKLTLMKNLADPLAVQSGVLAALMAREGCTGPLHVLDGKEGLGQIIPCEWRWPALVAGLGRDWRILRCGMKAFPTEALTHTPLSALLDLIKEHDLVPDGVNTVTIHTLARAADILADPEKYNPHTKETADHSLPYVVAAALVDRQVTPAQFSEAKLTDPVIRGQLSKVKVVADPSIEALFPRVKRARVVVQTSDGRTLEKTLDHPRGDPQNPLSDADLAAKVAALAEGVIPAEVVPRMREVILRAETFDNAQAFMKELILPSAS